MVGKLDYSSVPTTVDLENNQNHTKYTINRPKSEGLVISKPLCTLMAIGALLLAVLVGLLVFFFIPRCTHANSAPSRLLQHSTDIGNAISDGLEKYENDIDERLPKSIEPTHYRLQLMTFLSNKTTNGALTISLLVKEATSTIVLHLDSESITIDQASLKLKTPKREQPIEIKSQDYIQKEQKYRIVLVELLQPDEFYTLELLYVGKLNQHLLGYYYSTYTDSKNGNLYEMASTQFSPIDARKAFPCFDEPSFKANFTISLARTLHLSTLSNMPMEKSEPDTSHSGWVWDHYQTTPKMSTYLVAFMVHNLQGFGAADKLIRTFARSEVVHETEYAAGLAPKLLHYFEEYFHSRFPLSKIDIVAVPEFGFSAMENWGLIIFRESTMLIAQQDPEMEQMRHLAAVLAHEIAHQWFGNLATPKWWGDLWLKEGFATYLQYMGTDFVEPSWKFLEEFMLEDTTKAMALDSYASSRPISTQLINHKQIRQAFDALSYSKGACVIRMMHHFLQEPAFKDGLIRYLAKYKYSNADSGDLFTALTNASHTFATLPGSMSVNAVMETWTRQAGFPVVSAIFDAANGKLILSQRRFFLDETGGRNDSSTWWVPLSFTTSDQRDFVSTKPVFWLKNVRMISVDVNIRDWYLLNLNQTGHFIVNYDERNWRTLTDVIMRLPPLIRAQLISDSMDLARANLLDYDIPLKMIAKMAVQDDQIMYLPTAIALQKLEYISDMLSSTPAYGLFEEYQSVIFKMTYGTVSLDTDYYSTDYLKQQIRGKVLKWACRKVDSECAIQFHHLYRAWMEKQRPIPSNIQHVVYCTGIRQGSEPEWNYAYDMYTTTKSLSEKAALLDGLGCTTKKWLLSRYLDNLSQNQSSIKIEDAATVFTSIASNTIANGLAFDFLRLHWDELQTHYGEGFGIISKMVKILPKYMNTEYQLEELVRFKNYLTLKGSLGTTSQAFDEAIEKVRGNVEWMKKNYDFVEKWLNDHKNNFNLF